MRLKPPVSLSFETVLPPFDTTAQWTRMRSCPCAARAASKPASTLSSDMMSTLQKVAPTSAAIAWPLSSLISKIATLTPASRSARTVASPRPDAPPVTTADREESSFMACLPYLFSDRLWHSNKAAQPMTRPTPAISPRR